MKLGLSTAAYYVRLETEDAAAHIQKRFELDCVEVFLETRSEYSADFGRLVREKLNGVPATSVHPLGTAFENSVFGRSARQRADAMEIVCGVLDAAQALDAGIYVYHGNHNAKGGGVSDNFERFQEGLALMNAQAKARGIRLCWENVSWCVMSTPERVRKVRDMYPDMGFVLDVKQAMQSGFDARDFLTVMGDRLMNVHVLDCDAQGKLCLPGQGCYDFKGFFAALRSIGYDKTVILEPYSTSFSRDEEIEESIAFLRAAMRE